MHFSVIIPARNEEATIDRCVESVMACAWAADDFEVLVVDNGSSDRTAMLAAARGARVLSLPDGTIARLRNYGALEAQGDILAFLDADCTVPGNWLGEAARYIEQGDVVCFGSPPIVPADATWVQEAWFAVRQKGGELNEVDWLESMNMFVRRREFLSVGGFNEELVTCEDYDLSLRLGRLGRLVADSRIGAVHHGEAASLGHFFRKELWRGTSNLTGVIAHGVSLREAPSVLLPLVYGLLMLLVPLLLVAGLLTMNQLLLLTGASLVLAWQAPLLLLAAWKNRRSFCLLRTLQLYLLLNVYFLARGGSVILRR
ncbi:hypothetical protein GURASL_19720 [Geotalea uraniireducens]|uniref:Glycosyltransferase 2-like domain-containing protein n=1 Tax=Geotalea uraniireducens TaxID=351604 RepID=A0ABM8EKH9_9BACT|nr:glycosyltransferase [Geotalea uraniireducens]BDV43049.1 hypothetical protein GURASL_19720 [Geotalea uraniireducens]